MGTGSSRARAASALGDRAGRDGALEHAVARAAGGLGIAVGAAHFRRLRQGDEQRRLADREPARLLAEVGERGGAHALDVAAEGGEAEVEREDLGLS